MESERERERFLLKLDEIYALFIKLFYYYFKGSYFRLIPLLLFSVLYIEINKIYCVRFNIKLCAIAVYIRHLLIYIFICLLILYVYCTFRNSGIAIF